MHLRYVERQAEVDLQAWLKRANRKPLIVRGARQTGKSTLVREFARRTNIELVEINLEENQTFVRRAFDDGHLIGILTTLERLTGRSLRSIDTPPILFLDEIQAVPSALQSLRYFFEQMPHLPVIAAGSTLEFILGAPTFSVPVGRVEFLALAPLTFKEFLRAHRQDHLVKLIETAYPQNPASLSHRSHTEIMCHLRNFFEIGGMPESVAISVDDEPMSAKSLSESRKLRHSLLTAYRSDLQKYPATAHVREIVREVFDRVSATVSQRVKYSRLAPSRTARDVRKALALLIEAGVLLECLHTHANGIPLLAEVTQETRKLFFLDVGLMLTSLGLAIDDIPSETDDRFVNEGALAEQFVAQELSSTFSPGEKTALTYWLREEKTRNAEVDFVIAMGARIIPIEVKSGTAGTLRSLREFCQAKFPSLAIRLDANMPSITNLTDWTGSNTGVISLVSLPLYMASEIKRIAESL